MGGQIEKALEQLSATTTAQSNRWRRLTALIASEKFQRQFEEGSDGDREFITTLIIVGDEKTLEVFLKKQRVLENLTVLELRKLAAKYGIEYYCNLTHGRLVSRIRQERKRIARQTGGGGGAA